MTDRARHAEGEREVEVRTEGVGLPGLLGVPDRAHGLVLFCHGSGSSRHSVRNRFVAEYLRQRGMGTLLFDLLTESEGEDRELVFDIGLLAERVKGAVEWIRGEAGCGGLGVGLFGASTGAAAALVAEGRGVGVSAVVSRGGRPDLAGDVLEMVRAPTLLIVGGADHACIPLNEGALGSLMCEKRLEVVDGATHLFEESGAMAHVASLACEWFTAHVGAESGGVDVSGS